MANAKRQVVEVEIGSHQAVEIDKLYGPLIMAKLLVIPDATTCEWVIMRQKIDDRTWHEVARIPGQMEGEGLDLISVEES